MKSVLQGKSGNEIIADAERIKAERREREKVQAIAEIKELENKRANAEKGKSELSKFEIKRSRFYKKKGFIDLQPIIELTVRNGTQYAISRAYFKGTVASPNRSVPWIQEDFNYQIPGGLEPGEEATWNLSPNMFSKWGSSEVPNDAILTVTVEQLDGPNKDSLFSIRNFSEDNEKRLKELKKEFDLQ
jgi:hypothetical protein